MTELLIERKSALKARYLIIAALKGVSHHLKDLFIIFQYVDQHIDFPVKEK